MKRTWKLVALAGLLAGANASADLIPVIPGSHWAWRGNYVTGEALHPECVSLATRIGHDPVSICGTAPQPVPAGSFSNMASGYYRDYKQPPDIYHFYYFNAYACANSRSIRYFADIGKCIPVTPISTLTPSNPKANGPSCPANPQDKQPSCGNPISPGNGAKVQQETDYVSSTPGLTLDLIRTDNGAAMANFTYGTSSNHLVQVNGSQSNTIVSDANGSITGNGSATFNYDARGRMVAATTAIGLVSYKINALGQRVQKTTPTSGTVYHYDSSGKLIAESTGSTLTEYVYLGDMPVAVLK